MKSIPLLLDTAFGGVQAPSSPTPRRPVPRSRYKLWELSPSCHCPLVGTCISVTSLRQLAKRCGMDESGMSDYALHSVVVDLCRSRNDFSERLQRFLEERYSLAIQRFGKVKTGAEILALWRKATVDGNIASSLWAAWTHADIDDNAASTIFGDLHMLSHQLGAQQRSDKQHLLAVEQENAKLQAEITRLRERLAASQRMHEQCTNSLQERQAERDSLAAQLKRNADVVAQASQAEASNRLLEQRNLTLSLRVQLLEQRYADLLHRTEAPHAPLTKKVACEHDDEPLDELEPPYLAQPLDIHLPGRHIVCIGGRPGLIDHYRKLVEASGGLFTHHDGGQQDNAQRLDLLAASADAVVCIASHISHPAYWRIKAICKQRGLTCLFLSSAGVTSFARCLATLTQELIGLCRPRDSATQPLQASPLALEA